MPRDGRAHEDRAEDGADRQSTTRSGSDDDPEPVPDDPDRELGDLDTALRDHEYPTTDRDLVAAFGDRDLQSQRGSETVAELLEPVDGERYADADEVRERLLGLLHR